MKKKISIVMFFVLIIFSYNFVFAATTQLVVEKESIPRTDFAQGYVDEKIVSIDKNKGELTVEVSIANKEDSTSEKKIYENTEIYILVAEKIVTDEEKFASYRDYISTLVGKIFDTNEKTKIGIIGMKGTISDKYFDEEGNLFSNENDQAASLGTADNAEVVVKPTDDIDILNEAFLNMNSSKISYYNNLQAAIRLANSSYSEECNKILICLYDNIPGISIGTNAQVSYGGMFNEYSTLEEAVRAHDAKLVSNTKSEILKLKENYVDFILLRPSDTSFDQKWYNNTTGSMDLDFDGSEYVIDLYGTLENPTYGKMYSLENDTIEKIITENIYSDIVDKTSGVMENVNVAITISDLVASNFNVSVEKSSSTNVDNLLITDNKNISCQIEKLEREEAAKIRYKLSIKDMTNSNIIDKVLDIHKSFNIKYVGEDELNITVSPQIKLSELSASYNPTAEEKDPTISEEKYPYTGKIVIGVIFLVVIGMIVFTVKKNIDLRDVK